MIVMCELPFKHKTAINLLETIIFLNALAAFVIHTIIEPISKNLQKGMQDSRVWLRKDVEIINILHISFNKYNSKNKTFPAGFAEMGSVGYDLRTKIISNNNQKPARTQKKSKPVSKNNSGKSVSEDDGDGDDHENPQNNGLNDNDEIFYYVTPIKPVSHAKDLAIILGVSKKTIQNLQSAKQELLPSASYLPYTKEKLYLANDVIKYLSNAKKTNAIVDSTPKGSKRRGRPRISATHASPPVCHNKKMT
jgi:hypothetical protein